MGNVIERTTLGEYRTGRCEVCGEYTFDSSTRGTLDVCERCFWQDDEFHKNPNEPCLGPNGKLSVNTAKNNYRQHGVCSPSLLAT